MQTRSFPKAMNIAAAIILGALPLHAKDKDTSLTTPSSPQTAGMVALNPADFPICAGLQGDSAGFICNCPSEFQEGLVWGDGPYTGESNICTAARHSGLIKATDTLIEVVPGGGFDRFPGSSNEGVTTADWGAYGRSFDVHSVAAIAVVETADVDAITEVVVEVEVDALTDVDGVGSNRDLPTCARMPVGVDVLACSCPADGVISGVWGSNPYTADSDICTAARHAGYMNSAGGSVVVLRLQGLETYIGIELHGITSSDWNSFGSSITFDWN